MSKLATRTTRGPHRDTFKALGYRVIFGTDTRAGRNFDLALIALIVASVVAVMLDSIDAMHARYGALLRTAEWLFTITFTLEYAARLYCSPNRWRYARSFYGVVDLCSILPTYVALIAPGASLLLVIRLLRVLRIFRVLKLFQYVGDANVLLRALVQARRKILIFLFTVLVAITIFGSLMYIIEGPEHGFTSIPKSIYWAIVTVTTVGYGDITPQTMFGQFVGSIAMLTGYAIVAVPTGIVSSELIYEMQKGKLSIRCSNCEGSGHDHDAQHCKYCGAPLPLDAEDEPD
jgi:voltage-gated potassium channel